MIKKILNPVPRALAIMIAFIIMGYLCYFMGSLVGFGAHIKITIIETYGLIIAGYICLPLLFLKDATGIGFGFGIFSPGFYIVEFLYCYILASLFIYFKSKFNRK